MKTYRVEFFRPSTEHETAHGGGGPRPEILRMEARSKAAATRWARAVAKERGWRLLEVYVEVSEVESIGWQMRRIRAEASE